ncbi:hypothetical protein NP233_g12010 [Leucocoprinus birnbaumii]|uniref:Uncharacterized protein n=1 Tax=Leucocoprinus birnbaumii TaxID=56174 RepID=A0AAD5YKT9_9AGAR|nr:hypothetical protein NP233_g12010 [Leucocoprinus birnbaumii]
MENGLMACGYTLANAAPLQTPAEPKVLLLRENSLVAAADVRTRNASPSPQQTLCVLREAKKGNSRTICRVFATTVRYSRLLKSPASPILTFPQAYIVIRYRQTRGQ